MKYLSSYSAAFLLGSAVGLGISINHPYVFALCFFLPLIWLTFSDRWRAALFICAFYLSVGWEIVPDIFNYCGWMWQFFPLAVGSWIVASIFPTLPWLLLFPLHKDCLSSLLSSLFLLFFVLAIPPFGIATFCSPLTSAGLIYPGMCWLGVLLCCILICTIAVGIYIKKFRMVASVLTTLLLIIAVVVQINPIKCLLLPRNWVAINTNAQFVDSNRYLISLVREQLENKKQLIILPENTVNLHHVLHDPDWKKLIQDLSRAHATLIAGAYGDAADDNASEKEIFEKKHDEGVLLIDQGHLSFHHTRQPLPIMSWRPFGQESVAAYWLQSGVHPVQNHRVAVMICFEDFLPWITFMSMADHPDILISIANHWWNMPTAIHKQLFIVQIWGRLFHLPVMMAENL